MEMDLSVRARSNGKMLLCLQAHVAVAQAAISMGSLTARVAGLRIVRFLQSRGLSRGLGICILPFQNTCKHGPYGIERVNTPHFSC